MARSSLFGRRVHLSGSLAKSLTDAPTEVATLARESVVKLVRELVKRGANFVIPVDVESVREDGQPLCFDWLVWKTAYECLATRPSDVPGPMFVAVKHHKTDGQIPAEYGDLWRTLSRSSHVQIESAAHWNMAGKRMEVQAAYGDILITIGGGDGVLFLANLYHDAGKPVVPLNFELCAADTGSRKLHAFGMSGANASRFFQCQGSTTPKTWLARIGIGSETDPKVIADDALDLLEDLAPPSAFAVRLLNPAHEDYADVQAFFDVVVEPVIEGELGFKLVVVDGKQGFDHLRMDQEIFAKLYRSRVVIADITGSRPNCFLELGYAMGRGIRTIVTAREGTPHPFDIQTLSAHHWAANGDVQARRRAFREHWDATRNRPIVPVEPLIP